MRKLFSCCAVWYSLRLSMCWFIVLLCPLLKEKHDSSVHECASVDLSDHL